MKAPLLALLASAAVTATAAAQTPPLEMSASIERTGRIDVGLSGPPGAHVSVTEGLRRVATVTLDATGAATIPHAGEWRCERRRRTFVGYGDGLRAEARVTTPGCRDRYKLVVRPRGPRAGRTVRVRIEDRFGLGDVHARVCARGPARAKVCRRAPARLRLRRAGRWRVHAENVTRTVRVRRPRRIRLLATGDSMIQIIDSLLAQRLEPRHRVRSDAHISSGLSKPFFFHWPRHARSETARYRPDATVMFIGANDGFPFGDTQCCGRAWSRKYARVVSRMMRTYARTGAVYWCLLPAPRPANFRRVFVAVNRGLRMAQRRNRRLARLIDLPRTFTPGYAFRQSISWRGRTVSVRQDDGIHLNVAGASIAATLVIRRMARDGLL